MSGCVGGAGHQRFGVVCGARHWLASLSWFGVLQAVAHETPLGLGVVDQVAEFVDGDVGEFLAAGV